MYNVIIKIAFASPYFKALHNIVNTLNRRNDLYNLIAWAERKRLTKPLKFYWFRVMDEEHRVLVYGVRDPHLTKLAHAIHNLQTVFAFKPVYYLRGSAACYRRTGQRA